MRQARSSGILLHLSSLPGDGIGDLGTGAVEFLDYLSAAGQTWWQMLPVGPTGAGNSPYQSASSFAGNPQFVNLDLLAELGLLEKQWFAKPSGFSEHRVEFGLVAQFKKQQLQRAFRAFGEGDECYRAFLESEAHWLNDYALFCALSQSLGDSDWSNWPAPLRKRNPAALLAVGQRLQSTVRFTCFVQYMFFLQWNNLRQECVRRSIRLIGDVPIFVSHQSAEVWSRPELFQLDSAGRPKFVAGVPPDYFCAMGQRWGNPVYHWPTHEREGYAWWIDRVRAQAARFDMLRLDHFRGFEAYWRIPASSPTAKQGRWVPGPRDAFFEAVKRELGCLPFIAEDLGEITPQVLALRERFGLPGMNVLQFAFGSGPNNPYLPFRHTPNSVVYTGTHDNNTTCGWFESLGEGEERRYLLEYTGRDGREIHWDLARLAFGSPADLAVFPLQDVLGLPGQARMNIPGKSRGNWRWRVRPGQLHASAPHKRLGDLTAAFGRKC
jgi:4-alpha-glucanotransferase